MKNNNRISTIIRWIARIWGSISLAFLLFMVGAQIISAITGNGESGEGFRSASEVISFIFFPVSTIIGLATAYKWEGMGGWITVLGFVGFLIVRPDLLFDFYTFLLAAPGLFYLVYYYLHRGLFQPTTGYMQHTKHA